MSSNIKPKTSPKDAPTEPFKRAVSSCLRAIARQPELEVSFAAERPGLILFTSGSTGEPKGVVHDFSRLLQKFRTKRPALRTLNFLLFDHWGGLNTLLHCLSNASPVVSYVRSAAHGASVGAFLVSAMLPVELARPGQALSVEWFGDRLPAHVVKDPLWDPTGERIRA